MELYGKSGRFPTLLSFDTLRIVGIGAIKTTIEATGAAFPQNVTQRGTALAAAAAIVTGGLGELCEQCLWWHWNCERFFFLCPCRLVCVRFRIGILASSW